MSVTDSNSATQTAVIPFSNLQKGGDNAVYAADQKKLLSLIERRHPKYVDFLTHWNFLQATYQGGRDWFAPNIFRYVKEGTKEFKDRLKRAYRFNHTREVVDLINKYLFKQEIARSEGAPEYLLKFWSKSTKSGLDIKGLARQVSKKTSQYGRIAIVVDMPKTDEKAVSVADAKKQNLQCYAYIIDPQQLLDYSFDENGNLNWVLIHEIAREDVDPFTSTGDLVDRYRLWEKNTWTLYERKRTKQTNKLEVTIIDSGNHDLGEVPVVLADNIISDNDEYSSSALIDDIAYLDRAVANYLSNLDAIIQDQTFSQLAMPSQNIVAGEDTKDTLIEMGTKRVFVYDGSGTGVPFFLSPDVKQGHMLIEAINKIVSEIYHTVGLAGERTKSDNAMGIDNSSGVAKAYDFERVNALLAAKADSLEHIENKIAHLVAKWNGSSIADDKPLVSYPDNFDTRGLYDEFDIAARLMLIEAPDSVRRNQMESVIEKLFPQLKEELRTKMLADLKSWPITIEELTTRISDKASDGKMSNSTTISSKPTADKAKEPSGAPKAEKNNRQGQVTKTTPT